MKTLKITLSILCSIILMSCNIWTDSDKSDYYYIRNDEADMPVWVCGNKESETFVIMIHGGPGGSAMFYHDFYYISDMEEEFAFVYWDQRAAGASMGNSSLEYFNMEQFIEDTDMVVDSIIQRYDNPSIFLCGHSWGGLLGTAYLLETEHQDKVNGWIEIDGGHDLETGMVLSRQFVIDYANQEDDKVWNERLEWYEDNQIINMSNVLEHAGYVKEAFGYTPKDEVTSIDFMQTLFLSPQNFLTGLINNQYSAQNFDIWEEDLTDQMDEITIPSLVIWGEHDGILPVPLAQQAYDALGTDEVDKYITILPNSGHSPVDKDKTLFQDSIIEFVNRYR